MDCRFFVSMPEAHSGTRCHENSRFRCTYMSSKINLNAEFCKWLSSRQKELLGDEPENIHLVVLKNHRHGYVAVILIFLIQESK